MGFSLVAGSACVDFTFLGLGCVIFFLVGSVCVIFFLIGSVCVNFLSPDPDCAQILNPPFILYGFFTDSRFCLCYFFLDRFSLC